MIKREKYQFRANVEMKEMRKRYRLFRSKRYLLEARRSVEARDDMMMTSDEMRSS
jgi:hypothetical protein